VVSELSLVAPFSTPSAACQTQPESGGSSAHSHPIRLNITTSEITTNAMAKLSGQTGPYLKGNATLKIYGLK